MQWKVKATSIDYVSPCGHGRIVTLLLCRSVRMWQHKTVCPLYTWVCWWTCSRVTWSSSSTNKDLSESVADVYTHTHSILLLLCHCSCYVQSYVLISHCGSLLWFYGLTSIYTNHLKSSKNLPHYKSSDPHSWLIISLKHTFTERLSKTFMSCILCILFCKTYFYVFKASWRNIWQKLNITIRRNIWSVT